MSKVQYNLKQKTDYLQRKMFLDPAGPVTIQRFEEVKYNKLVKFEQEARGFFWVPEEVSLTKDAQDFKKYDEVLNEPKDIEETKGINHATGKGPENNDSKEDLMARLNKFLKF